MAWACRSRRRKAQGFPASVHVSVQKWSALQAKVIGRRFRALLRKADLPPSFTLYSLRHTFASQLLDQGVKPVDVARVMGHKNVITTLTHTRFPRTTRPTSIASPPPGRGLVTQW